jgi:DMSO/TMAO reductase YedYZ heme-binding membrane subunit
MRNTEFRKLSSVLLPSTSIVSIPLTPCPLLCTAILEKDTGMNKREEIINKLCLTTTIPPTLLLILLTVLSAEKTQQLTPQKLQLLGAILGVFAAAIICLLISSSVLAYTVIKLPDGRIEHRPPNTEIAQNEEELNRKSK